jgi:hypothetical protein
MDSNAAGGGKAGLSREKIEAALGIKATTELSERERMAPEYADRVSPTPVDVPDACRAGAALLGAGDRRADGARRSRELQLQVEPPLRVEANNFGDAPLTRQPPPAECSD